MLARLQNKDVMPPLPYTLDKLLGIVVKKVKRGIKGNIISSTGLSYGSRPPCGRICVFAKNGEEVWIRGFYLYVCLEHNVNGQWQISALALVDGNVLNTDEDFYRASMNVDKVTGLGPYGTLSIRYRHNYIFPNPLGAPHMDRAMTLIHSDGGLANNVADLRKVAILSRTITDGTVDFHCYRYGKDSRLAGEPLKFLDPFPR